MFNKGGGAQARFEHPLNEYKGANVTRILHDFYDSDPARGFYGGGGFDARSGGPLTWGQNVPEGRRPGVRGSRNTSNRTPTG
jgi:hypothetical protein